METSSNDWGGLAKALVAFQAEMESISKDAVNPFYKSKYASLDSIIAAIKPGMKKHGLAFVQMPDGDSLTTIILHETGQFIRSTARLIVKDQTPQGLGSAITYMRRYALSAALGLATEDDDDGNGPVAPKTLAGSAKTVPPRVEKPKEAVHVGKDPEAQIKACKERIAHWVEKLSDGEWVPTDREEKKKWFGDRVFELTTLSLPLASSLADYETIMAALEELANK